MEQSGEEEKVKKIIQEIVNKMGFKCEIETLEEKEVEGSIRRFNIKTEDSSFLIGQHGVNLHSLQHIARVIVRKKIGTKEKFILDVNSYRQERNDSLVRFAHSMAEQALREKRAVVLRPMSPYERRVIHMELSNNSQIKTESIGEGIERKIVISPINLF